MLLIGVGLTLNLTAQSPELNISGRLKLFASLFATDNQDGLFFDHAAGEFGFRRIEARLGLSGNLNRRISYSIRFDAFSNSGDLIPQNEFPEAGILGTPRITEYLELNLYRGMIRVTDFLIPKLDLTVGKQRIFWGTADRINVVDNLNPIDFANFLTFDPDHAFEKRPQTAINLEYYFGATSKIQLVWLLEHQVSPLPYGYTFMIRNVNQFDDIQVEKGWRDTIAGSNFGLRFKTTLKNIDLGFSYYHGNASLPVLTEIRLDSDSSGIFTYPGLEIIGLDLAGEMFGFGYWLEVALAIPETTQVSSYTPVIIEGTPQLVISRFPLFEKNHFKYVVGLDYNFGGGFYANLQFLHGFFDEFDYSQDAQSYLNFKKGQFFGELANYFIGRVEYTTAKNNIKIGLNGMLEMAEGNSFVLTPQMDFKIADHFLIQTGAFLVLSGDEAQTKFGQFKEDKLIYLGFRIDF